MDADSAKKWGTVFMGRREASLDGLDSMQSAALQQQHQKQVQEDYLERVKSKATERAKEILGAAYAERQQVLHDAEAEGRQRVAALTAEVEQLRAAAAADRAAAAREKQAAGVLRQEAEQLRDSAQGQGYESGVDKARQELAEFRAQMGDALGAVMMAVQRESGVIFERWRDDLVGLCRAAVEKGVNIVLTEEHSAVLEHMLMQAVRQLEDHRVITLRVHPDDEAVVGDMFLAAREQISGVQEWRVNGDASLEPGSIVAESAGGSVDNRLEYYRELVDSVMGSLHLPAENEDAEARARIADMVQSEAGRIAGLAAPQEENGAGQGGMTAVPDGGESAAAVADGEGAPAMPDGGRNASAVPDGVESPLSPAAENTASAQMPLAEADAVRQSSAEAMPPSGMASSMDRPESAQPEEADLSRPHMQADAANEAAAPRAHAHPSAEPSADKAFPETAAPRMPRVDISAGTPSSVAASAHASSAAAASAVSSMSPPPTAPASAGTPQSRPANLSPSLAELEDELFADDGDAEDSVLVNGGFLTPDQPA